jgi:hypothetical protein
MNPVSDNKQAGGRIDSLDEGNLDGLGRIGLTNRSFAVSL